MPTELSPPQFIAVLVIIALSVFTNELLLGVVALLLLGILTELVAIRNSLDGGE
ncbi:hypothetical protein [Halorussus halophilus]|uniref:hypothetical protein n=1 Tax=Halorussus halophilus TaxID=2650975 RepID=UPI001787A25A|nr:hypothetical protein [Halorussus halophilus]